MLIQAHSIYMNARANPAKKVNESYAGILLHKAVGDGPASQEWTRIRHIPFSLIVKKTMKAIV